VDGSVCDWIVWLGQMRGKHAPMGLSGETCLGVGRFCQVRLAINSLLAKRRGFVWDR